VSRKRRIRQHYGPRISPDREHFDIVDWADAEGQLARFNVLAANVDLAGKTLLDIGCGLGDLLGFLTDRGVEVDYTGVDLLDEMVAAARKLHPTGRFISADVFDPEAALPEELVGRQFDVVFCSGAFNLDLGNNRQFLPRALARMFELSHSLVVFNLLHSRAENKYDQCAYFHPDEILEMLAPLPCRAEVIDDYLSNDFTFICVKTPPV